MFRQVKGINMPKNKGFTKYKPIEISNPPQYLYFPMNMHIGAPAEIAVEVGDKVKIGDVLGRASGFMSTNISSSVSGQVVEIKNIETLRGDNEVVVVKNDFKDQENLMEPLLGKIDSEALVDRIDQAGIVGKGGAGFPTKVKYKNDPDNIDYLVINGSECEGYSTTDFRVMVEFADQIALMVKKIIEIYGIKEAFLAIERDNEDAIKAINQAIEANNVSNFKVHLLGTNYPQGHDALQIRDVLGTEIPNAKYPADLAIIQSNVSTIKSIYDAVFLGLHYSKRVMTVSGEKVNNPKNLMVRIGTPISHLINECGGLKDGDIRLINGGPMMGKDINSIASPVEKNTTTILAIDQVKKKEETSCIRCARCIDVCPVDLQPVSISKAYRDNNINRGIELRSNACINCGCCTYICPANIPLLDNIQKLNQKLKEQFNG